MSRLAWAGKRKVKARYGLMEQGGETYRNVDFLEHFHTADCIFQGYVLWRTHNHRAYIFASQVSFLAVPVYGALNYLTVELNLLGDCQLHIACPRGQVENQNI